MNPSWSPSHAIRTFRGRILVAACAFLAALSVSGQATGQNFTMLRRDFQLPDGTFWATTGDFDGDKKPDLLLLGNFGLSLLRGKGDGTFQPGITTAIGATEGLLSYSMLVADFNRDGRMDLLIGANLYLGQADGSFRTQRLTGPLFLTPPRVSLLITADFNEDGTPDLAGFDGSSYQVLLGRGDGTFQRSFSISGVHSNEIYYGSGGIEPLRSYTTRVHQDGHVDLVLPEAGENRTVFRIFRGDGNGSFQEAPTIQVPLRGARPAVQADFNGDQIIDWIVSSGDGGFLALRNPDGSLQDLTPWDASAELSGDFDSDGRPDLVGNSGGSTTIFLGSGDGFSPSFKTVDGYPVLSVDWNDDGRLDLAIFQQQLVSVSILLNHSLEPGEHTLTTVESSASSLALVAPGSLASLFGSGFSTGTEAAPILSGTLAGTQLRVRDAAGQTLPAELLYVSPTQINFRIPPETTVGEATIDISQGTEAFVPVGVAQVEASAPTLFGCGRNANTVLAVAEPAADNVTFEPPPCPGDELLFPAIITFYGTGFEGATVDNTRVWAQGLAFKPLYVGPAEMVPGLDKVVIRVESEDVVQLGDSYSSWVYITLNALKTNGGYTGIY